MLPVLHTTYFEIKLAYTLLLLFVNSTHIFLSMSSLYGFLKKVTVRLFYRTSDSIDKWKNRKNSVYQLKLGQKSAVTARDITDAFGPATTIEYTAQWCLKKFRSGNECFEDD